MTVDVYEELRREALARIDGTGIDPQSQMEEVRELLEVAVEDYQRRAHLGDGRSLADPRATVDRLVQSVTGRGPLSRLLDRPDVEEIFIEGDAVTYLEAGGLLRSADLPATEAENRQTIDQLISTSDRRLDASNPIAQARVLAGSARLTAVIPPVGDQLSATIRKYALRRQTLDALVTLDSLTRPAAAFLEAAMRASASVIISGAPGSGKTSFLSALIAAVPADHCIRSCEEVRELHVPLVHGSYYESRPPSLDGSGEITLRDLVKVTLAMRPDLIVVGEVRGAEAPRFEGHQPGRDSVQGRRRCRMRRRPTSKPQPRGSRRSLAPVRSRHHRSQSRCQRPSHHAPNRTSHRRRLNALHKGAWHHHHRSWSTSVRSRARPVSRLRRGTIPPRAGSRTVRRRRLLESVEHKRQRAKERRRQARARAL